MINKLIIKDPFEMPAVDDTTVLVLRECADLVPHCWIWNESVGYLEVVAYSGYDIYVTVKNVGMKENATSGTIFPSCMEFLITAPNATPIIDNTVTCLRADFKCPTVGQEALMSVDSTSAIRTGDLIIVDTRYQYLVTEIINEHTMKVLNEEKGKEGGVINVNCNECVPVKIFESTHCCEALQEQVDDIYNRLDTKKSITPATDSLISVSNGRQVLTDAFNDVVLDVDTDLSKYNNTVSRFITLNDIPQIPTVNDATLTIYNSDGVTPFIEFSANAASNVTATLPASGTNLIYFKELYDIALTTARFVPNTNSAATSYSLGNSNNWINESYIENTRVKTLIGQNYADGITYSSSNAVDHVVIYGAGTTSLNYGQHCFNSGGNNIFNIGRNSVTTKVDLIPINSDSGNPNLGSNINKWGDAYINNLYADNLEFNTTYVDFNFTPVTGGINIASGKTLTTTGITISNPHRHGNMILFMVVTCNLSRLRSVSNSDTINHAGPRFQGYVNRPTDSARWKLLDYYTEYQLTTNYEDRSYSLTYTFATTIPPSTTYSYNASIDITTVGFDNGTLTIPGGTSQRGKLEILYGHIN